MSALEFKHPHCQCIVLESTPSTNTYLLGQPAPMPGHGLACLALEQTQGRGKPGRDWYAEPEASLTFSLLWHFEQTPKGIISIEVGKILKQSLHQLGATQIEVKPPNDLVVYQNDAMKKLGGILVEAHPEDNGWVIGVGLNIKPIKAGAPYAERAISLEELGVKMDGGELFRVLVTSLIDCVSKF